MQETSATRPAPDAKPGPPNPAYPYAISYLGLRRCIGIIGITLPFVLVFGKMLLESPGLLPSISAYYYSVMRDVFVGSLCAAGVFLLSYRFDLADDIAADIAGISAIGVALFPTPPAVGATERQIIIGVVHSVFSAGFFLALAFFALVLFRRTDPNQQPTPQKTQRNTVYLICGIVIVVCFALEILDLFLQNNRALQALDPGLWLESLSIFAFGIAWFIKGETILKD